MTYLFAVRDPIPQRAAARTGRPRKANCRETLGACFSSFQSLSCSDSLRLMNFLTSGSRRQSGDLSSHPFRAGDDFVEHSVKRPEFFTNIVGEYPAADGMKRADALVIHFGQSGISKNLGDGRDNKENVDLFCKFRV